MKRYVFDSYAILAFLEDEKGADLVENTLREVVANKARGFLSVINWGEIYYSIRREQGQSKAEAVLFPCFLSGPASQLPNLSVCSV